MSRSEDLPLIDFLDMSHDVRVEEDLELSPYATIDRNFLGHDRPSLYKHTNSRTDMM